MKTKSAQFDRILLILALCCGGLHTLMSLLQYFFDLSVVQYVDYALGGALAVAVVLRWVTVGRMTRRLCAEQKLLIGMLIWYAITCVVMTGRYEGNWILANVEPYFDTCVSLLVLFPLGRYIARHGAKGVLEALLHAALIVWTLVMVYVILNVFQNHIITTPSGGQIGMTRNITLSLNCYYNTTGAIQIVFTLLCCCMVAWCRHPAAKIAYVLMTLVNYVILVLSNSRTAFLATGFSFGLIVGLGVYGCVKTDQMRKRLILSACAFALSFAAFLLMRSVVFYVHEAISHLSELLGKNAARAILDETTSTFTGRTKIWGFALKAMVYDEEKFFFGVTPVSVISMIKLVSDGVWDVYTHNQFLEIGMALGVPGLCMFTAWCVLIARSAFRMVFVQKEPVSSLLVIAVIIALGIGNMLEATLLFYGFVTGCAFFILCGWVSVKGEKEPEKHNRHERRRMEKKRGR